jgi:outer membrane protein OmpA-like peptidoglycan-associated protein
MSNEHRDDIAGPQTVDGPSGDDGFDDEGPLDPSVFFGLFDDLADDHDDGGITISDEEPPPQARQSHSEADPDDGHNGPESNGSHEGGAPGIIMVDGTDTAIVHPAASIDHDDSSASEPEAILGVLDDLVTTEMAGAFVDDADQESSSRLDGPPDQEPATDKIILGGALLEIEGPPSADEPTDETPITDEPTDETPITEVPTVSSGPRILDEVERSPQSPVVTPSPKQDGDGSVAKAALVTIAVGLFAGLIVAFVISLRSPDPTATPDPAVAEQAEPGAEQSSTNPEGDGVVAGDGTAGIDVGAPPTIDDLETAFRQGLALTVANDRADLTSLQFESGTSTLAAASLDLVDQLGGLLADSPASPATVVVRTYSEPSAADNLALSQQQAEALVSALRAAGAGPEQVRAVGLGSVPLSPAQPVPNFVVVNPGFGDRSLDGAVDQYRPFQFGSRTTVFEDLPSPLRLDAVLALGVLGAEMRSRPNSAIGLAAYSFFEPDDERNRALASATAQEVVDFMAETNQIDPSRTNIITPAAAPYVPTAAAGNHIWLQTGPASRASFDVAGLDMSSFTFTTGSSELTAAGAGLVDQLASILMERTATVVIDVRSYDQASEPDNLALSESRAQMIATGLIEAGVDPNQLRLHASGASSHSAPDGPVVTATVVP